MNILPQEGDVDNYFVLQGFWQASLAKGDNQLAPEPVQ